MFLPWRDHSFLWDEDDIGWFLPGQQLVKLSKFNPNVADYWHRRNNPVPAVTGVPFRETGQEVVTQEISR